MANNRRRRGGYGFGINLTGPGTVITLGFIALAIGMGVLLSRGITPKHILTDPGQTDAELEVEEDTSLNGQKGLQLKTLKFKECGSTMTVDLMLDRSGSMGNRTPTGATKMARLQEAVLSLLKDAHDESIIGIQSFDSVEIKNEVEVSYYKDVKSIISQRVNALFSRGFTPTHNALAYSYDVLREAIPKFPSDRKFNYIFVSDGAPCPGFGCLQPGESQDPRLFTPNPADQIKSLKDVTVYTLGIYDGNETAGMATLLKDIATSPNHYYAANTADDTKRLLTQITQRICNSSVSPTPAP